MAKSQIPKVAMQGQGGSYHDRAAQRLFPQHHSLHLENFVAVFTAVDQGTADYGVSAIENTLVGSISPVYDLLRIYDALSIVGEVFVAIDHALIGLPAATIDDVKVVYSHPVALDQCTDFLGARLSEATLRGTDDTAGSVELVKRLNDPSSAAIAGAANAERFGMQILNADIANDPNNFTRFLVLRRTERIHLADRAMADKTSLFVERLTNDRDEHAAGTLFRALGCFANNEVPLTKVESRPVVGKPWHYSFYIDCGVGGDDPRMRATRSQLAGIGALWRELGTYRRGEIIAPTRSDGGSNKP
jgi:prephenate dehydratase